jgi:hypothetical protein
MVASATMFFSPNKRQRIWYYRKDCSIMAYIPKNARWYLADLVLELSVAGVPHNLVHVNIHLIDADSPERAYEKANALGRQAEQTYINSEGQEVRVIFRGLRDLNVIHNELEDGAELAYEESIAVPEAKLRGWLRTQERLSVFRDRESGFKRGAPNCMPESVMKSLEDAGFHRDAIHGGE